MVVIATALLGLVAWKVVPTFRPRDLVAEAAQAYRDRDWARAEGLLRARLDADKGDLAALRDLARVSARQGKDELATGLYDGRVGLKAMVAEDHFLLGRMIARQGNPELALKIWGKALRESPDHPEMLEGLAGLLARSQRLEEAEGAARRLLEWRPWEARGHLLLGAIRSLMDDPAGTIGELERGWELDPDAETSLMTRPQLTRLLARSLLQVGRPAEARLRLQSLTASAEKSRPDDESSWLMSRVELQDGSIHEGSDSLRKGAAYREAYPTMHEPAPYLGSARCEACHPEIGAGYRATRHARTFHRADHLAKLPRPDRPLGDPDDPKTTHSWVKSGPALEIVTTTEGREKSTLR